MHFTTKMDFCVQVREPGPFFFFNVSWSVILQTEQSIPQASEWQLLIIWDIYDGIIPPSLTGSSSPHHHPFILFHSEKTIIFYKILWEESSRHS